MIKRIAGSAIAIVACGAGVMALTHGSTAAGGVSDETRGQQADIRDQYSVFKTAPISGTVTDDGWSERFRKTTASRGGHVDERDVRTAVTNSDVTVEVALTDRDLCLRVADSGGGSSIGCSQIDEPDKQPQLAVDRTNDGMRITVLVPDAISRVSIQSPRNDIPATSIVNNTATALTDAPSATVTWTDEAGKAHSQEVRRP